MDLITTDKYIHADKVNKWLKKVVAKAIDCGDIETFVYGYYNKDRWTPFSITKYTFGNFSIEVWQKAIDVYYYGNNKIIKWVCWFKV